MPLQNVGLVGLKSSHTRYLQTHSVNDRLITLKDI